MGVSPQERLAISGADDDGVVDFGVLYVFDRGCMWAAGKALNPACAFFTNSIGEVKEKEVKSVFFFSIACLQNLEVTLFDMIKTQCLIKASKD